MRTPLAFRTCTMLLSLALAIAAGLAAARPAAAVEQTGEILGTVLDEKGQPLPGTTLTLKGENLQGERAAVSGPKGEFAFRSCLPAPTR